MVNKYEYYKQAHHRVSKMTSVSLGVLTSSIYQMVDVFNMSSCLIKYITPVSVEITKAIEIHKTIMATQTVMDNLEKVRTTHLQMNKQKYQANLRLNQNNVKTHLGELKQAMKDLD